MKWVTREDVRVGRIACSWLIRRFIDPDAQIVYVPRDEVMPMVEREGANPFHVPNVEFSHRQGQTPFEAMLATYELGANPALALLGRIVNGADTDNRLYNQPEGPGVRAVTEGWRAQRFSDEERIGRGAELFDTLYAYCQVKSGTEG